MIAIAHSIAVSCYLGAAATAAAPLARPVRAPVRWVLTLLLLGVVAHIVALVGVGRDNGSPPITGLGPALSFGGLVLALTLLAVEAFTRDVSLTLVAAPLAALPTAAAALVGLRPMTEPGGAQGAWLLAHIALSFIGIAAFATAAAAGTMYLVERRELRSRRFGAVFRLFPPLETLDRVNHIAALTGCASLTLGVLLAGAYALVYRELDGPKILWACGAWLSVSALAAGRVLAGWSARRAALVASVAFAAVIALYVAVRVAVAAPGEFL
jgi:HemX protein